MAVAKIGDTTYDTLSAAVIAANAMTGNVIIDLIDNIALTGNLNINNNITIQGSYTMSLIDSYTKTIFTVKKDKSLTLDGGLVIECGNHWSINEETYWNAYENCLKLSSYTEFFTPEETGITVTGNLFSVPGTLNLNNVTIQNFFSISNRIVAASAGGKINLTGAQILHCAQTKGSGLVVDAANSTITITMNDGTLINDCYVGANHGLFKVYSGTTLIMNGGTISNIKGWDSNGVAIGSVSGYFIMNGGTITGVVGIMSQLNGRNAPVYIHRNAVFIMNGGSIINNYGTSCGGVDAPYTTEGYTGYAEINGGTVAHNNVSFPQYENSKDVRGGEKISISGGIFSQNVSQWCTEDYAAVQLPDGTWGVKTTLFEAYVCVDGVIYEADLYVCINGVISKVSGIQSRLDLNQEGVTMYGFEN